METQKAVDNGYIEHLVVPFGTNESLIAEHLNSTHFREWPSTEHSWQLRIWGSPGSGKTTISAFMVQHLQKRYAGQNVRIASIFFKQASNLPDHVVLLTLFQNIAAQLAGKSSAYESLLTAPITSRRQNHSSQQQGKGITLEKIRHAIQQIVAELDRAFLIIDDIDVCSHALQQLLESEILALRNPKLSILITSRPPHQYPDKHGCDICRLGPVPVYWFCGICQERNDGGKDNVAAETICQSCKQNGTGCTACLTADHLYEPYDYVMYQLSPSLARFRQFVAYELESTHGDLELQSTVEKKPPWSALGRALNRTSSKAAEKLFNRILVQAKQNIACAKLRLDNCLTAQNLEDVERQGDRLPDNIIAMSEAVIDRVKLQADTERQLGLHAIIAAATLYDGRSFAFLERWLLSKGLLEKNVPHKWYNLLRTLRAACGVLIPDCYSSARIEIYNAHFKSYVKDNYNDALFQLRSQIGEAGR